MREEEEEDLADSVDSSVEMLGALLLFSIATAVVSLIAFVVLVWRT